MRLLVFTDRHQARRPLPAVVLRAVDGGARHVVLREKDLPRRERAALAEALRALLAPAGGRLIVAGPDPLGGTAVHLAAGDPVPGRLGPVGRSGQDTGLVGRSCHDATELSRLTTEHYVTLSPVFATRSKPGYGPPLGLAGLARLCRIAEVPAYALGGVTERTAGACVAVGAAGVAVMGAVMRAHDPARYVSDLLQAVTAAEGSARQGP